MVYLRLLKKIELNMIKISEKAEMIEQNYTPSSINQV